MTALGLVTTPPPRVGLAPAVAAVVHHAPGFFDAGVGRFLVSPGFGGAAALLGGLLAFAAALRKTRADREASEAALAAGRESARETRWWEAMIWVYDRATAVPPAAVLPASVSLDMVDRLYAEAQTGIEKQLVAGLLDLFTTPMGAP